MVVNFYLSMKGQFPTTNGSLLVSFEIIAYHIYTVLKWKFQNNQQKYKLPHSEL